MSLTSIEHSKAAYAADVALYTVAVVAGGVMLLALGPPALWRPLLACTAAGLVGWTAIEYGLHRFVLHGLAPFSHWHLQHHQRPSALICAPTLLSASLIGGLIYLPALLASDVWCALAFTFGVLIGYLAYTVTHHATHHWRADGVWLRKRKRWHALHHRSGRPVVCYGVTTDFWDRVFCSCPHAASPPR